MNQTIARAFILALTLIFAGCLRAPAQDRAADAARPANDAAPRTLQDLVNEAAKTALDKFKDKGLKDENLSVTLIDLRDPQHPATAGFRGNERVYPASVVKLFYLAAVHRALEDKRIEDTPELRRALRDMIVDSSNEATQYIVDVLTPPLSAATLARCTVVPSAIGSLKGTPISTTSQAAATEFKLSWN